jgi:hypothetical protein
MESRLTRLLEQTRRIWRRNATITRQINRRAHLFVIILWWIICEHISQIIHQRISSLPFIMVIHWQREIKNLAFCWAVSFALCVCVCVYVRDTTLAALFLIHSLCFFSGFVLHSCFCLSVFVQTFFVWLTGVSTYMLQSMSPPPPVAVTFVEKRTGQPCICWNGLSHDGMEIGS